MYFGHIINSKNMSRPKKKKKKIKSTQTVAEWLKSVRINATVNPVSLFALRDSPSMSTTSTRRRSLSMTGGGVTRGYDPRSKVFWSNQSSALLRNPGNEACSIMVCTDGCPPGFAPCQHCDCPYELLSASDRDLMDPRIRSHCPGVLRESVAAFVRI